MDNVLTRKLEHFAPLPAADRQLLDEIVLPTRDVPARSDLIREGQSSDTVRLIIHGLAYRYKNLANGRRQVVAYLIPGDFCDLHVHVLKAMDHSIATVSACKVVDIPRHRIAEMTGRPALARALWWATLVDEGTMREWLLNLGQRPALERIAHLFCEFYVKLSAAGLVTGGSFSLPLTQEDVADTTGLSLVHVNRCLQQLRELGLLKVRHRLVEIDDTEGLMRFCGFNPNYLHLDSFEPVA